MPDMSESGNIMNEFESTNQVADSLLDKIDYLSKEYNITVARMIGILQVIQYGLYDEAKKDD